MTSDNYRFFTNCLRVSLEGDEAVIGFVALGSMAAVDYDPDRWSDHDFFVIVRSGEQERFRTNLRWLPHFDDIAMSFRETEHGIKVLYRNGHLLEFAVFDLDELRLARINRFRVLVDRADVSSAIANVRRETAQALDSGRKDDSYLVGMMLSNLLVGVGRYARGERMSGTQYVKGHSLVHLLTLANRWLPGGSDAALDDLDPHRRFERAHPELALEIESALALPTPNAAHELLAIAQRHFSPQLSSAFEDAVGVVLDQIDVALRATD